MTTAKLPSEQALAELVGRHMQSADQTLQALGIRLLEIRPGYARVQMPVRADMANHHGTCHGGFIFLLADSAFAFACNSQNHSAVAAACNIDFLAPAHTGEVMIAEAVERHLLRRSGIYDVSVTVNGRCVALFRGKAQRIGTVVVSDVSQE